MEKAILVLVLEQLRMEVPAPTDEKTSSILAAIVGSTTNVTSHRQRLSATRQRPFVTWQRVGSSTTNVAWLRQRPSVMSKKVQVNEEIYSKQCYR